MVLEIKAHILSTDLRPSFKLLRKHLYLLSEALQLGVHLSLKRTLLRELSMPLSNLSVLSLYSTSFFKLAVSSQAVHH